VTETPTLIVWGIFHVYQILFAWSDHGACVGRGTWHAQGITEMHTEVWWKNMKQRDHMEDEA